jgi:hypothetical protein
VGRGTGDDEAYAAVFTAGVAVFVLLVVRVSSAIAIVHPKPAFGLFVCPTNTPKAGFRQAISCGRSR